MVLFPHHKCNTMPQMNAVVFVKCKWEQGSCLYRRVGKVRIVNAVVVLV